MQPGAGPNPQIQQPGKAGRLYFAADQWKPRWQRKATPVVVHKDTSRLQRSVHATLGYYRQLFLDTRDTAKVVRKSPNTLQPWLNLGWNLAITLLSLSTVKVMVPFLFVASFFLPDSHLAPPTVHQPVHRR